MHTYTVVHVYPSSTGKGLGTFTVRKINAINPQHARELAIKDRQGQAR